jgi:signal transduction histidine kinase
MFYKDVLMKSDPSKTEQNSSKIEVTSFRKMGLHPLTLSFKNELEPLFLADYYSSSIFMFRFSLIAGFFYYGSFALLDYLVAPEFLQELYMIRFLMVWPVILIVFAITFTHGFRRYWQYAASFINIVASLGIVAMTVMGPEIVRNDYYAGLFLMLIYCYMLVRQRFIPATITGWIIVLMYIASLKLYPGVAPEIAIGNVFFLVSANILGMVGGYALEYYTRREFFYRYLHMQERRKVEMANTHLEEKVRIKTAELEKDIAERKRVAGELVRAKERAEESDRLKSAFLANISHEIRTPINGIIGFTNLLEKPNMNDEKRAKYTAIIKKSGKRLLDSINDLINMSRIEAGLIDIVRKDEDLNEITDDLFQFFAQEAKEKGLKFSFTSKLPETYKVVQTDREKYVSIITNLIKNAIKYTFEGSVEFGLRTVSEAENTMIEFFISDTGIGIPADQLDKVFDRFTKINHPKTDAVEGSGLGLSITKSYVELLGGSIFVESEENRGSTFRFRLPYNMTEKKSKRA